MSSVAHYEPGTIAVATVRGIPNVRIVRGGPKHWVEAANADRHYRDGIPRLDGIKDIRPLVVLDVDAYCYGVGYDRADLLDVLRGKHRATAADFRAWIATQIEKQATPPRIPEPGLWGVVHSSLMRGKDPWTLVRHEEGWVATDGGVHQWRDLIDPVLIREGIQS